MDLVREIVDEASANAGYGVTTHIICKLTLKGNKIRCTADEICKGGEYYWSLNYAVNGYTETTYNEYVEFMYRQAIETAKQVEKFSGVKIKVLI